MICDYCCGEEFSLVTEYTRFEKNNVLRCQGCGLVYLETNRDQREVESFYASGYRQTPTLPVQSAEEHFHARVTQHEAENRIQFISSHLDLPDRRILEIGSASGSLLEKLREHGCREAIGVELDEEFSKYARGKGFQILTRSVEQSGFKEEFDGVVSFHTLEHVYDPLAVIQAIYRALKPGGCFLGEVPNQDDWRIQIFDDEVTKRFHYDPNHYYYYSPKTLGNYLQAGGFVNVELATVERYNSLRQLKSILLRQESPGDIAEISSKYIFPQSDRDEVRLPDFNDKIETTFNRLFAGGVNAELMGNCLRWVASK